MSTSSGTGSAATAPSGFPFRQETRATVRKRIGKLTKKGKQWTATAGAATTVTFTEAKLIPDDTLVGQTLYIVSGTGAGRQALITDHVASTGVLTLSPTGTAPDSTSVCEIWEEGTTVEDVNDAINLAINDAQETVLVELRSAPLAVASDGIEVTLPANMVYVQAMYVERSTANTFDEYKPVQSIAYLDEYPFSFALKGRYAYVSPILNATQIAGYSTLVEFFGYRAPALPTIDADSLELPSEYVTYMAAFYLEAGQSEGPSLDPKQYAGRAGNWLRQALVRREEMRTMVDPDTVKVGA